MLIYILLILITLIFPIVWINYIFKKYDNVLVHMPFNGLEFGNKILKERGLHNVQIEGTSYGDHYDLNEKKVKVYDERLTKKSLTAISVISHEIGHAIQHNENYKPLEKRNKFIKFTNFISHISSGVILFILPLILSTGSFYFLKIVLIFILISLFFSIIIHLITLEVEIDASFNKAFPIIKEKVPLEYHNACHSVLRATTYTYIIGVIRNFLSLRLIWLFISRMKF